ncbi:16S rRNA (guanine(966)-N(2))-methyltransferase RsmD [Pseudorhodoferax sp. Leaf267]|nr:16S rRNA (guanine(966)-N(2))-methyltransferase RsmD [Pseudorhodoferax sp. Leaf267]
MPGEIRIIGGQWKRTRVPVADVAGLRPTPDRVRETLFNWLGQDLTGWRCVDMFAGSGALGFEAASRGAVDVRMFESDAGLLAQLAKVQTRLAATMVQIARGDGIALAGRLAPDSVDLVFLDPPFEAPIYDKALAAALRVLAPTGRIYLEAPELWTTERLAAQGLVLARHLKAGAVHAHLLERAA